MFLSPDSAPRGRLDGPHAVQVVLVWSWIARRQDSTGGFILEVATTLG